MAADSQAEGLAEAEAARSDQVAQIFSEPRSAYYFLIIDPYLRPPIIAELLFGVRDRERKIGVG